MMARKKKKKIPAHLSLLAALLVIVSLKKTILEKPINKLVLIRPIVLHPFCHNNIHTCLTLHRRTVRAIYLSSVWVCALFCTITDARNPLM